MTPHQNFSDKVTGAQHQQLLAEFLSATDNLKATVAWFKQERGELRRTVCMLREVLESHAATGNISLRLPGYGDEQDLVIRRTSCRSARAINAAVINQAMLCLKSEVDASKPQWRDAFRDALLRRVRENTITRKVYWDAAPPKPSKASHSLSRCQSLEVAHPCGEVARELHKAKQQLRQLRDREIHETKGSKRKVEMLSTSVQGAFQQNMATRVRVSTVQAGASLPDRFIAHKVSIRRQSINMRTLKMLVDKVLAQYNDCGKDVDLQTIERQIVKAMQTWRTENETRTSTITADTAPTSQRKVGQ